MRQVGRRQSRRGVKVGESRLEAKTRRRCEVHFRGAGSGAWRIELVSKYVSVSIFMRGRPPLVATRSPGSTWGASSVGVEGLGNSEKACRLAAIVRSSSATCSIDTTTAHVGKASAKGVYGRGLGAGPWLILDSSIPRGFKQSVVFLACGVSFDASCVGMRLVTELARLRSEELTNQHDWAERFRLIELMGGVFVHQRMGVQLQTGGLRQSYFESYRYNRLAIINVYYEWRDRRGRVRAILRRRRRSRPPFGATFG